MKKLILLCTSLCAMLLLISASPVRAQAVYWVGPNGADSNNCAEATPCATFQGAYSKGSASQIKCVGSGSYGPITITASVIIDCGTGNDGTIFLNSTNASLITIVTSSTATIVLRHLSLDGHGVASYGINAAGSFFGGTLIVDECTIQGFHGITGNGIAFVPNNARGLLQVSNSQIFDNTDGIVVTVGNFIASVMLNRVELVGNSTSGLVFGGPGVVAGTIRDSVLGSNGADGLFTVAQQSYFTVEGSSIVANLGNGIHAGSAGSNLSVGSSTIGGNGTGILAQGGSIVSFGNNQFGANGVDGNFTSTKVTK